MKRRTRRIGPYSTRLLLVFAAVAIIPAWGAESAREIVARSFGVDRATQPKAIEYTYRQQEVLKELDAAGQVKKTTGETRDILFLGGRRFEHLIAKDGKPLAGSEARKEQERLDKAAAEAAKLTPDERRRRFADYAHERDKQLRDLEGVPDAYDFTLTGQPALSGRPCFLIEAKPRDSYRGKNANLLRHLTGKLWIDQASYQWVRIEASATGDITFGLFLAKLAKGAAFSIERTRVNNEIWLPKEFQGSMSARALIKRFRFASTITFSEYKKFTTESKLIVEGVAEPATASPK